MKSAAEQHICETEDEKRKKKIERGQQHLNISNMNLKGRIVLDFLVILLVVIFKRMLNIFHKTIFFLCYESMLNPLLSTSKSNGVKMEKHANIWLFIWTIKSTNNDHIHVFDEKSQICMLYVYESEIQNDDNTDMMNMLFALNVLYSVYG